MLHEFGDKMHNLKKGYKITMIELCFTFQHGIKVVKIKAMDYNQVTHTDQVISDRFRPY